MIAIAVLALIIRLVYIIEIGDHPLATVATGDPLIYDLRAVEISEGKWLSDEVFFHSSPAYPYILGVIYSIFGHSYFAARFVQSLFGAASCLLLLLIARSIFGPRQGVIAGIVAALYVPLVFFDSELLMITYVIFFSLLALRLLQLHESRHRSWLVLLSGLSLGVAALGKPLGLGFAVLVVVNLGNVYITRSAAAHEGQRLMRRQGSVEDDFALPPRLFRFGVC